MKIMQICVIFAVAAIHTDKDWHILLYSDFFKFLGSTGPDGNGSEMSLPAPYIDMFTLWHHMRATIPMSNILTLTGVMEVVQLVQKFWAVINREWDCGNSLALGTENFLNNSANKNMFHTVLTYW